MIICQCLVLACSDAPGACEVEQFLNAYNATRIAQGLGALPPDAPLAEILEARKHLYLSRPPLTCSKRCGRCKVPVTEELTRLVRGGKCQGSSPPSPPAGKAHAHV